MAEYIDRDKLLGEIDELKLSQWFNRGKKTEIHNQHGLYLERKEGVEIVTDLCIKQQVTADVIERSKIDRAIKEIEHARLVNHNFDDRFIYSKCLEIIKKNIREESNYEKENECI